MSWERTVSLQHDKLDVKAWLVQSKMEHNKPYRLWVKGEVFEQFTQEFGKVFALDPHKSITDGLKGSFLKGRAMKDMATSVSTCGGRHRPRIVFRAVHDASPGGDMEARGYEKVETDAIYFQQYVQKHLYWLSRSPSPFMSVTENFQKAMRVCAYYNGRDREGIKILVVDTLAACWDYKKLRLWSVHDLSRQLDLRFTDCHAGEFLVENYIPDGSIIGVVLWEEISPEWYTWGDKTYQPRQASGKRKQEDNGCGEEKRARYKKCTAFQPTAAIPKNNSV